MVILCSPAVLERESRQPRQRYRHIAQTAIEILPGASRLQPAFMFPMAQGNRNGLQNSILAAYVASRQEITPQLPITWPPNCAI
jgi:hypothetical protein